MFKPLGKFPYLHPVDFHFITDTRIQSRFSHLELGTLAFRAGIPFVQYRNKDFLPERDLEELRKLAGVAKETGRVLIVNDDADLAAEVGAGGVHLGVGDGSPAAARARLGPAATIGATVHNFDELHALRDMPIDYIGVGPVFGTRSKDTGLPDLGLEGLRAICEASPFPVVAIGSVDARNLADVAAAGAKGAAILSAFCLADDPGAYAAQLFEEFG